LLPLYPAPIKDSTSYVRVKDSLASGDVIKSDNIRQDNPSVSIAQSTTLTEGNNQFAFELYRQMKDSPSNLSFLLQHLASAEGQTKQQMVDVLNFYLYEEELLQAFNWLGQELNSRDEMKAVLKTL
jgi:serine protease inhibitor